MSQKKHKRREGRYRDREEKEEKGELSFHSPDVTSPSSPLHLSSSSPAFRPVIWVKRPMWCQVVQGGARECKILVGSKLLLTASVPGKVFFILCCVLPDPLHWPSRGGSTSRRDCLTDLQDSVFVLCLYYICVLCIVFVLGQAALQISLIPLVWLRVCLMNIS